MATRYETGEDLKNPEIDIQVGCFRPRTACLQLHSNAEMATMELTKKNINRLIKDLKMIRDAHT